jgi:hypothetical protein
MASSKMTLIGMNIFMLNMNDDLFKNLTLPEGLDKATLTDNILLRGGEFEVAYADPTAMQSLIGIWSRREQATFKRWVDALSIEYAPLENYDRYEHWTDEVDGTGSSESSGSVDTTSGDTSELTKSAFDQAAYSPYEKTINDGTVGTTTSDTTGTTMSNDSEHDGRIHGNIGVTSSQQLLESELLLGYWNVYQKITELFLQEFVIPVYS